MAKQKKTGEKKLCISCHKPQLINEEFYISNNPLHIDGRFPSCKTCVKNIINYNDMNTIYNILSQMNRPFLKEVWQSSINEANRRKRDLFGTYYKNLNLKNKNDGWNHYSKSESDDLKINNNQNLLPKSNQAKEFDFTVTQEMIHRWGNDYEPNDYMKLEEFYHRMKEMNRIETPQEEAYLKKLAVISLKMDQELHGGNYDQAKKLGDLFSKYMQDSQLRAIDKTEADKTGGIRNFGTIFAEVEKDGHIPPWEQYRKIKGLTQDIIDLTIMHIENFTLRLNKIERMTEPPIDTPKLTNEDTDIFDGDV